MGTKSVKPIALICQSKWCISWWNIYRFQTYVHIHTWITPIPFFRWTAWARPYDQGGSPSSDRVTCPSVGQYNRKQISENRMEKTPIRTRSDLCLLPFTEAYIYFLANHNDLESDLEWISLFWSGGALRPHEFCSTLFRVQYHNLYHQIYCWCSMIIFRRHVLGTNDNFLNGK